MAVVALVTLAAGVLDARGQRAPANVTLRGRVLTAESGAVIPYARLRLAGANWFVRSDADGSFSIDVPPRGTLIVSKAGFVASERELPLKPGDSEVRLTRATAIAGRVVNEFGEPIVDARVAVLSPTADPSDAPNVFTDDRGEFRIGGLAPGKYRIAAETRGAEQMVSSDLQSVINGAAVALKVPGLRETTFTSYFPDALDPASAVEIALAEGEERGGLDVRVPNDRAQRQPLMVSVPLPRAVDQRPPDAEGGSVRGLVSDLQNRPLPFALVTLDGNSQPSRNPAADDPPGFATFYRTTVTDERGAFEFSQLRTGVYSIRAAKAGYSQSPAAAASTLFSLNGGGTRAVDVRLTPWGAVTGRLRDEFGDPVQNARISLLQSRYERGRRRLIEARVSSRVTNDRGEFRLFAIPPGEYVVRASVPGSTTSDLVDYPPVFYPGTQSGAEARPLAVDVGSELGGLDFSLIGTPTARITGTTFDSTGQPTTQLRLSLVSRAGVGTALEARIGVDGTFEFQNVPPGQYILKADSGRTNTYTEGEFAALPVSVGQTDIRDLRLQATSGSTITGRFVFDRSVRTSDPPPTAVRIAAVPEDFDFAPDATASAQANAEGVFQLRGVNGRRRLEVTRVPPRYMVKAILINGRDATDDVTAFGRASQSVDDVEVVLTDRVTQLTGAVEDGRARAGAGVHVLVFSADRARWYPSSRHLQHQVTAAAGTADFTGIPAGSFFAVALRELPAGDDAWQDPAFLEAIRPMATGISIGDSQAETVVLRLPRP